VALNEESINAKTHAKVKKGFRQPPIFGTRFLQIFQQKQDREDMVLLSMTPATVAAVKIYLDGGERTSNPDEPLLDEPAIGKPISHGQIIDIAAYLKNNKDLVQQKSQDGQVIPIHLADLLHGSSVYIPPLKPKPEPTSEYKALMARLRKEEEARSYERMLNPLAPTETFSQRFPNTSYGRLFDANAASADDDEMTYQDVDRQLTLIINVLVTVVACSIAVWVAARRWDTPQRLALSMSSSIVLAIAEVVIYWGYINRLKDARNKEKKKVEKKEIMETWVIEPRKGLSQPVKAVGAANSDETASGNLRMRKAKDG
jgi:hypothetical protein